MIPSENEGLRQENRQLRERFSRLSEAGLRIKDSLAFDMVLQEVVDSAQALVGSRYGGIAVFEAQGRAATALRNYRKLRRLPLNRVVQAHHPISGGGGRRLHCSGSLHHDMLLRGALNE